ncbi:MAG: N-6 DNA methylase [Bacteroidales bacterium]|nr:N-6 DNA methylase [Bacteroidales bacterium]
MSLFQSSIINKYLKTLNKQDVQAAYTRFRAHFHNATIQENIRNSKEEQYQEGFLNDLFVNVLGYVKNPTPDYNLTTEYKNVKDSKKADGAIVINNTVKAVIELKSSNTTDLSQVEVQAFSYKNNQSGCVYVITSNFEKLRFYIDNAIEYIEFNLFTLTEKDFEMLYLCLAYQNIEKDIPKNIKEESVSQEDKVTKQLYNDYSLFKRELHQNLVAFNPEYDALLLFKKSQKLLDRFLFLFFAEDRQLLPPNSVRLILNQWQQLRDLDEYIPLYDRFKKYFGYLNTGYKGKQYDVFAYNGGLFKPDTVLDKVRIDDNLLYKHTYKLSEYDFESEVDVNILGHIFENSLNELDELKAELEGSFYSPSADGRSKGISKRKKDGVFYTPKYITKYIVDNTVGKLCLDKKAELGIIEEDYFTDKKRNKTTKQFLTDKLNAYRNWLLQITICDPACGSGAFLNQALNFLIDEHRNINEMQAKLFGDALVLSDIENTILENNLFGVDINDESVEIAKLSLWLRTAQPNRKLNDLSNNIKCGNSLIDEPAVAGDKAFDWEREFPQVFGHKKEISQTVEIKKNETPDYLKLVQEKLLASQQKAEQALELSKEAIEISKEAYQYAEKLETVSEPDSIYGIRKGGFDVVIGNPPYIVIKGGRWINGFEYNNNAINYIKNKYKTAEQQINTYILFLELATYIAKQNGVISQITPNTFFANEYSKKIRNFLVEDVNLLEINNIGIVFEDANVETAITTYRNNKYQGSTLIINNETNFEVNILKLNALTDDNKYLINVNEDSLDLLLKLSKNDRVCSVAKVWRGLTTGNDAQYLSQIKYTELHKPILSGTEIHRYFHDKNQKFVYYDSKLLDRARDERIFILEEKLISKFVGSKLTFCYDNEKNYVVNTACSVELIDSVISIKYLLSLLNSKLLNFYFQMIFSDSRTTFPIMKSGAIEQLPIVKVPITDQQPFIAKADLMLLLNKELQEISGKFQRTIQRKFDLEELPTRLQNWHQLTYSEFIKELGKRKLKLSLSDEAEWESYFVQEINKAHSIKKQIDETDREIDKMVYALYGLTKEEIEIVEIESSNQ